jgi:hypothetical protein
MVKIFNTLVFYLGRMWPIVRSATVQLIGLAAFVVFVEGIRRIYQPAAMIVGGGLVVFWTILKVRENP